MWNLEEILTAKKKCVTVAVEKGRELSTTQEEGAYEAKELPRGVRGQPRRSQSPNKLAEHVGCLMKPMSSPEPRREVSAQPDEKLGLRAVRQTGTAVTKTAVKSELELSDGRVPAVAPVTAVAGSNLHTSYIGPSIHLFNENVEDQSHSGKAERVDDPSTRRRPATGIPSRGVNLRSLTDGSRPVSPSPSTDDLEPYEKHFPDENNNVTVTPKDGVLGRYLVTLITVSNAVLIDFCTDEEKAWDASSAPACPLRRSSALGASRDLARSGNEVAK
ncbi:hypothetical protein DFH07DRAFT_941891 [Mycena maculata]|uniref:Uncharacterized protein n=1 Tax=Mycena maculata TaxID=230809 RepID=A0AAD7IVX2_9AGAR|nr:hypothetical protein DFH07DRAFT_941891 [Mycena maculata]